MSGSAGLADALASLGVTHVVGIPDNTSGPLFLEVRRRSDIRLVTATREGEAIALAAGLWLGGASPLVVIQNTGLLEAGDGLRGTAVRMAAPLPLLITGRGYAKMARAGVAPTDERTRASLTRPDVDSTALLTEPTLDAWGVPYEVCGEDEDPVDAIADVIEEARTRERPVARIVTGELRRRP